MTWAEMSRESFNAAKLAMHEAYFRSSVSRSYYAAYAAVTQILVEKGLGFEQDREGPSHQQVKEMIDTNIGAIKPKGLRRLRALDKKLLKQNMNLLYENRLDADYRPSRSVDENRALNSLVAASRVLGLLGVAKA